MATTNYLTKLDALRQGEIVDFEGITLRMIEGKNSGEDLVPGDTYYACRNTEQLLTVREVAMPERWVMPKEVAYAFNTWECVGVEIVEA